MAECSNTDYKVLFEQDGVYVHTATPPIEDVCGELRIIEKERNCYIVWIPIIKFDEVDGCRTSQSSCDSDDFDWAVINPFEEAMSAALLDDKKNYENWKQMKHKIHIPATLLHSIRTSHIKMGLEYLIFSLKDGAVLPAFHFHKGGAREILQFLERYLWLSRSSGDSNCLEVVDSNSALRQSLAQLQIFSEASMGRLLKGAYLETMDGFSRVTKLVWDTFNGVSTSREEKIIESESFPSIAVSDSEPGFEVVTCSYLGEEPAIIREDPLHIAKFATFFDLDGRLSQVDDFLSCTFHGGLDRDLRRDAWKYLLNYYEFNFTNKMKVDQKCNKCDQYYSIKQQWQLITALQEKRFKEFRIRKSTVEKDVLRTDRMHNYFKGDDNPNLKKMHDILLTYCFYNFDLGYVQGMSDLLSPILLVMEDEVDAFWCFVGLMERMGSNFDIDQKGIQKQLNLLYALIRFADPVLSKYLDTHDSNNLYFCFRWLLVLFKREFALEDIMRLWEVTWSQRLSKYFHLFICLAIIMQEKELIISNEYGFNEIIKHVNGLALKLDLEFLLKKAEALFIQIDESNSIPSSMTELMEPPDWFTPVVSTELSS